VTLAGQEIQANLRRFVKRWTSYAGSEKAEAQTFLNELFACYGTDRQAAGVHFEENQPRPDGGRGFLDALWPGHCLIEMKRPAEAARLPAHRQQPLDYWRDSADAASDRPAVDYVVLCAFARFEIWEPGRFPRDPRAIVDLAQLPDRYDTLLFLGGQRPGSSTLAPAALRNPPNILLRWASFGSASSQNAMPTRMPAFAPPGGASVVQGEKCVTPSLPSNATWPLGRQVSAPSPSGVSGSGVPATWSTSSHSTMTPPSGS